MKIYKYIPLLVFLGLIGCYEDLGNYEYKEINTLEVDSILPFYELDMGEVLQIYPQLKGTLYQDTTRFTYEWEIHDEIVATTKDLNYVVNILPGAKICRYIVQDKETTIKSYFEFSMNVSSTTAGDLIVVLSKENGKAELSYQRLDKPADFSINFYEERFKESLGVNPKQLVTLNVEAPTRPFTTRAGGFLVLVDDQLKSFNKSTLVLDTLTPVILGEHYTGASSYPPADVSGYQSQFAIEAVGLWRTNAYGNSFQQITHFAEVSGGALYLATLSPQSYWGPKYSYDNKSPYGGTLSPFCYFDEMAPTPNDHLFQLGYTTGEVITFDQDYGKFCSSSTYGGIKPVETAEAHVFSGYKLVYGAATVLPMSSSVAILNQGSDTKMVLLKREEGKLKIINVTSGGGGVITEKTRFYMMKNNEYLFFTTNDKLYRYNIRNIENGIAPSAKDLVGSLKDFGYTEDGEIIDLEVSRTERTLIMSVSRYGNNTEGTGEELKGDVLLFDLNATTLDVTPNKEKWYYGVSGYPVDLIIKYQTHWRDGLYYDGSKIMDKI